MPVVRPLVACPLVLGVWALVVGCGGRTDLALLGSIESGDGGSSSADSGSSNRTDSDSGIDGSGGVADCGSTTGPIVLAAQQSQPLTIAVDATSVYWTSSGDGSVAVMKVPLCGGAVSTLAVGPDGNATGLAVDTSRVYWVSNGNRADGWALMSVPVNGGTSTTLASGPGYSGGLTIDATSVYWTNNSMGNASSGTVMRMPLGGGAVTTLASQVSPLGIAVDATSAYWTNGEFPGTVVKVPIVGGTPTNLASEQTALSSIVVNSTSAFWTTQNGGQQPATVSSVPINGGTSRTLFSATQHDLFGLAVDATSVYWVDDPPSGRGALLKMPIAGGGPVTLASGLSGPNSIAVDATSIYWSIFGPCPSASDCSNGSVMKLRPK